jgi:hypothetical protein
MQKLTAQNRCRCHQNFFSSSLTRRKNNLDRLSLARFFELSYHFQVEHLKVLRSRGCSSHENIRLAQKTCQGQTVKLILTLSRMKNSFLTLKPGVGQSNWGIWKSSRRTYSRPWRRGQVTRRGFGVGQWSRGWHQCRVLGGSWRGDQWRNGSWSRCQSYSTFFSSSPQLRKSRLECLSLVSTFNPV